MSKFDFGATPIHLDSVRIFSLHPTFLMTRPSYRGDLNSFAPFALVKGRCCTWISLCLTLSGRVFCLKLLGSLFDDKRCASEAPRTELIVNLT